MTYNIEVIVETVTNKPILIFPKNTIGKRIDKEIRLMYGTQRNGKPHDWRSRELKEHKKAIIMREDYNKALDNADYYRELVDEKAAENQKLQKINAELSEKLDFLQKKTTELFVIRRCYERMIQEKMGKLPSWLEAIKEDDAAEAEFEVEEILDEISNKIKARS